MQIAGPLSFRPGAKLPAGEAPASAAAAKPRDLAAEARLLGRVAPPRPTPAPAASLRATFDGLRTIGGGPAQARLLSDNLEAWNARWADVEGATESIDAVYFSLERDIFGFAYLGHLLKKQFEGVATRVMTDAAADNMGQRGFTKPIRGKDYLQELANHGGEAYVFHPLWQRPFDLLKANYSFLASNHDKIQVVDQMRSTTGGRNIGIEYLTDPADIPGAWRDIDVSLIGDGPSRALKKAFDAELAQGGIVRRVKPDRFGNWVRRDIELIGAYCLMDLWLKDPPFTAAEKASLRGDAGARKAIAHQLVERAVQRLPAELPAKLVRAPNGRELKKLHALAEQLVDQLEARGSRQRFDARASAVHETDTKILDQTSAAGVRVNDFATALVALIDGAKNRVVIENPYVVLTEDMLSTLERASKRGVEIIIGTNSPLSTDSTVTQAFFLEDWPNILARLPTARIFVATGERKFHGKSAIIDDELSLVTTYNLDLLSGYINSEVGAAMWSKTFASELYQAFLSDHANPKNGVLEYKIKRDAQGRPIVVDGKAVAEFGPEDHLTKDVLEDYRGRRKLWAHTLRNNVPYFRPLRHPSLESQG